MADFLTAAALLGLIIVLLAVATGTFSRFNEYQWARQRCLAAATAELDSITATGSPVGAQDLERVWPQVTVSVDRSPAGGPWAGLELIRVTTSTGRVKVHLVRYIQPQRAIAKGGQN